MKKLKVLLIAWFDPNGINTVREHIFSLQKYSQHEIEILNTYRFSKKLHFVFKKNISRYDALIFHNTATYDISFLRKLDRCFSPTLSEFKGQKVLMKQDEMRRVNSCLQFIEDFNVSALTTCVPEKELEKVYPRTRFQKLKILPVLTGYVTPKMKTFVPKPYSERIVDVCYRGMETPFEWGELGYEKFYIGEEFLRRTKTTNLTLDISSKTKDRLLGDQWIDLLNSSKAALAVESGASLFDWDGSIEEQVSSLKAQNPLINFQQASTALLKKHDHNIKYAQISPRHFEAASTRTLQILFEGEYSGLLKPWNNYVPLKKDFGNLSEVIDALKDPAVYLKLTSNAFESLIDNCNLTYEKFVNKFDDLL